MRPWPDAPSPPGFGGAAAVAAAKAKKWAAFQALAASSDRPIKPERTIAALRAVLDDDAIVVGDPGTPCPYLAAFYEIRTSGRTVFSNRAHGALGYALSAAMGAHLGAPGKKVVALMGDGSFGFTCGELETAVRMRMPITFIVFSNAAFGWIKAGQKTGFRRALLLGRLRQDRPCRRGLGLRRQILAGGGPGTAAGHSEGSRRP